MNEEKVCCNCAHCIRSRNEKYDMIVCQCEVYNRYLTYAEVMGEACPQWSNEQEGEA